MTFLQFYWFKIHIRKKYVMIFFLLGWAQFRQRWQWLGQCWRCRPTQPTAQYQLGGDFGRYQNRFSSSLGIDFGVPGNSGLWTKWWDFASIQESQNCQICSCYSSSKFLQYFWIRNTLFRKSQIVSKNSIFRKIQNCEVCKKAINFYFFFNSIS